MYCEDSDNCGHEIKVSEKEADKLLTDEVKVCPKCNEYPMGFLDGYGCIPDEDCFPLELYEKHGLS